MSDHETSPRTTGATVLTLVAVACAAGLADVLRRRRERARRRERQHAEAPPAAHAPHGTPTIPRQRRDGPRAETVRLTDAERDAFAGLVRRFGEHG